MFQQNLLKLESQQEEIESKYASLAFTVPNLIHESVPIGPDDTANKEMRKWGRFHSLILR